MEDEVCLNPNVLFTGIDNSNEFGRPECRQDGVHAMLEHGIHGTSTEGAYSVVLSAGYKDDKDSGLTL